jgi:hypothetical protein
MTLTDEVISFSRDYVNHKTYRTEDRKSKIRAVYQQLTGQSIKISCTTCYIEALFKIINITKMATNNYVLKKGVLLQAFGDATKTCTNDNLTDELAEWHLKQCPVKAIFFARMPVLAVKGPNAPTPAPGNMIIIPPVKKEEIPVENIADKIIESAIQEPKKEESVKTQESIKETLPKKTVKKPIKTKK